MISPDVLNTPLLRCTEHTLNRVQTLPDFPQLSEIFLILSNFWEPSVFYPVIGTKPINFVEMKMHNHPREIGLFSPSFRYCNMQILWSFQGFAPDQGAKNPSTTGGTIDQAASPAASLSPRH